MLEQQRMWKRRADSPAKVGEGVDLDQHFQRDMISWPVAFAPLPAPLPRWSQPPESKIWGRQRWNVAKFVAPGVVKWKHSPRSHPVARCCEIHLHQCIACMFFLQSATSKEERKKETSLRRACQGWAYNHKCFSKFWASHRASKVTNQAWGKVAWFLESWFPSASSGQKPAIDTDIRTWFSKIVYWQIFWLRSNYKLFGIYVCFDSTISSLLFTGIHLCLSTTWGVRASANSTYSDPKNEADKEWT